MLKVALVDCMDNWYAKAAKQETSEIYDGLIAELVEACKCEQ